MKKYQIQYTTQSAEDMETVFEFIARECFAPLTARRYKCLTCNKMLYTTETIRESFKVTQLLNLQMILQLIQFH